MKINTFVVEEIGKFFCSAPQRIWQMERIRPRDGDLIAHWESVANELRTDEKAELKLATAESKGERGGDSTLEEAQWQMDCKSRKA